MNIHDYPLLLEELKNKMEQPLPSKEALKMMFPNIKGLPESLPENVRLSAVMVLLYIKDEQWHLLTIRRTMDGNAHSGQISFPGGRYESQDADFLATALRETFEEVGIEPDKITPLGALSPVYIVVSNYNVYPFLGYWDASSPLIISTNEVHEVLEIPLSTLFSEETKKQAEVVTPIQPNIKRKVNAYHLEDNIIIWGATAIIIAELELLLRQSNH